MCVVRGYHVYKYVWDPSQKLFNYPSRNAKFPFSGTNSVVKNKTLLLLHSALASNRLDIHGLLTTNRYKWCYLGVLLVFLRLAIAFE